MFLFGCFFLFSIHSIQLSSCCELFEKTIKLNEFICKFISQIQIEQHDKQKYHETSARMKYLKNVFFMFLFCSVIRYICRLFLFGFCFLDFVIFLCFISFHNIEYEGQINMFFIRINMQMQMSEIFIMSYNF